MPTFRPAIAPVNHTLPEPSQDYLHGANHTMSASQLGNSRPMGAPEVAPASAQTYGRAKLQWAFRAQQGFGGGTFINQEGPHTFEIPESHSGTGFTGEQ
jgi:hypothetical protein